MTENNKPGIDINVLPKSIFFLIFHLFLLLIFSVVQQFYESRVIDEFVLRGNTATLKCLVPSFVGDFVDVIEWIADDGTSYKTNSREEEGRIGQNVFKFCTHLMNY